MLFEEYPWYWKKRCESIWAHSGCLTTRGAAFALLHALCLAETGLSPFPLYFTLRALFISLKEKDIQSK